MEGGPTRLRPKADIGHVVGHIIQSVLLGAGIGPNPEKTNGAPMLTLYDFGNSVCCQKVRITMCAKGLTWESAKVDLFKAEQYDPKYLKLNPKGSCRHSFMTERQSSSLR